MPSTAVKFSPRRGRPNARQVAAIERAILDTARAQFLEEGFDAVSMEGVAAATGVSKSTLYVRYPSKQALFAAVVKASIEEWSIPAAAGDHLPGDDLGEQLRYHARIIARSMMLPDVQAFQRLLLANRVRFPELSRIMYEAGYLYIVDRLTGAIEAAAVRDGIPARDPGSVARMLVSAITGWYLQEGAHHELSAPEIEAVATRAADLLLAARAAW